MLTTVPLYLQTAGRIGGFLVATALVLLGVAALVPRRRPRERGGFGFTEGREVDRGDGARPVVVEFTPHGATAPVRFRASAATPFDEALPVRYSLADPRNGRVHHSSSASRNGLGIVALVLGAAFFVGLVT